MRIVLLLLLAIVSFDNIVTCQKIDYCDFLQDLRPPVPEEHIIEEVHNNDKCLHEFVQKSSIITASFAFVYVCAATLVIVHQSSLDNQVCMQRFHQELLESDFVCYDD